VNIQLTDRQIEVISNSLLRTIRHAEEKASVAIRKGFHDAKQEEAFYVALKADAEAVRATLGAATLDAREPAEDAEDCCLECGEDEGFCQCEEDDQ
jgi:hypothetical protein